MNQLYDIARERFLEGQIGWSAMEWVAWLVTEDYVFDPAHTTFSADVPPQARVERSLGVLTGMTGIDGYADADPITFGRVLPLAGSPPRPCAALLLVGEPSGMLLWHGDTGFNLPFMADGSEVIVFPDAAFGGFFRL